MKQFWNLILLATLILPSCSKENDVPVIPGNGGKPGPQPIPMPPVKDSVSIFVKAAVQVGTVLYDSIPARLSITRFEADGSHVAEERTLVAGNNEVRLPKGAVRYRFSLQKWNTSDEKTLDSADLNPGVQLVLGGSRDIKRLRMEMEYLEIEGQYQPRAKRLYHYNSAGKLQQVDYFQKLPQHSELMPTLTDKATFEQGRLAKVDRFDSEQKQVGETVYGYDGSGELVNVSRESYGQKIHNTIEHGVSTEGRETDIYLLFDNGATMHYNILWKGGNRVKDHASSSTGAGEGGEYSYDQEINPFHQVMFPDLYLSHASRNNQVTRQKGYSGGFPTTEPYKYEYTYDSDGYPVMLIRYYKSYTTNQFLYKTKTVYTY